jgi:hypothetical protein
MRTRDEQIAIANEIIRQLGGNKFRAMTGAKNFMATENGLGFTLPGGGGFCRNGINFVKVKLTSADLYDMEFKRLRGTKITDVAKHEGIYNDMLQSIFTAETGLDTHL